jgi:protein SCO1
MSRSLQGLCLGLALLALGTGSPLADQVQDQRVSWDSSGWPIGDLALVDHHGASFDNDNLRGRWTLLAIADSRYGDPCSGTVAALAGLLRRIAGAKVIETTQAVLVSLRAEDTGADLARLIPPQEPRLIGVTGPADSLAQLADDLGLPYPPPDPQAVTPGGQDYAGSIWLIGPDAAIRAELLPPFDVPLLTAAYLKLRLKG